MNNELNKTEFQQLKTVLAKQVRNYDLLTAPSKVQLTKAAVGDLENDGFHAIDQLLTNNGEEFLIIRRELTPNSQLLWFAKAAVTLGEAIVTVPTDPGYLRCETADGFYISTTPYGGLFVEDYRNEQDYVEVVGVDPWSNLKTDLTAERERRVH